MLKYIYNKQGLLQRVIDLDEMVFLAPVSVLEYIFFHTHNQKIMFTYIKSVHFFNKVNVYKTYLFICKKILFSKRSFIRFEYIHRNEGFFIFESGLPSKKNPIFYHS
jgi:hypothetical protein